MEGRINQTTHTVTVTILSTTVNVGNLLCLISERSQIFKSGRQTLQEFLE